MADGAAPKKSGLLIALGGLKKPPAGGEPDADDTAGGDMPADVAPGGDEMKSMAADDAFDAIKSGDRALFADALDRYVKACM